MRKLFAVVLLVLAFAGTSCGINDRLNESRGRGDAPIGKVDDEPREVIQFPDRFSNVAHACDRHGHRVFVTSQTDSGRQMEVVADDSCG
jgi:hypothetical protein